MTLPVTMVIAITGAAIASAFDIKIRKIPNWLTFSMIFLGLILNSYEHGLTGFEQSFMGFGLGIFCLFLPFTLGGVGAGDVKLLGALGSLMGPVLIFKIVLVSALFGGLFSLIFIIGKKTAKKVFVEIRNKVTFFILTKKVLPEKLDSGQKLSIPYACAIAMGTVLVVLVLRG